MTFTNENSDSFLATGNIPPSRFVTMRDTGVDFTVAVATAHTDRPVGISQEFTKEAPMPTNSSSYAAEDGEQVKVYMESSQNVWLECGGAVTRGDYLTATANGSGVTAAAGEFYAAQAKESGAAGEKIRTIVTTGELET